ncbi:hypothetical protein IJE86_07080 [bacterium]|nr:hypothetical protein [bacterium]
MDNTIFSKFNTQNSFPPDSIMAAPILTYAPHSCSFPEPEPDFFSSSDGGAATSAGTALVGGLLIREFLQNITSKFFADYFSQKNNIDENEMITIAKKMLKDKKLMERPSVSVSKEGATYTDKGVFQKLRLIIENAGQNAHFDPVNNEIRVSKNTLISIPHEIGHAVEEHSTKFLRMLQRNRGNYTTLALLLYGLGRSKSTNKKGKETFISKTQNLIYKYNMLIPLLAFSPELITELAASKIGLNYIKQHIKKLETESVTETTLKSLSSSKKILKAAKKHYAIAFCTYLTLPVFAILDNLIFSKTTGKN